MSPGFPINLEALHSAMGCQPPFLSGPRCHWHTSELNTRKLDKTLYTLPIYIFDMQRPLRVYLNRLCFLFLCSSSHLRRKVSRVPEIR